MIPDNRSALRKTLSGLYWRMRWWFSSQRQIHRKKERLRADARRIAECPLFDATWYLAFYSDVADNHFDPAMHYLLHGASEGRDPGPRFSTMGYVGRYADVTNSGLNPLIHYIEVGAAEGREIGTRRVQSKGQRVLCICGEPDSVGSPYRVANLVSAFAAAGAGAISMTIGEALENPKAVADASLVVLWRTAWDESLAAIIRLARTSGAVIVFDIDDLMTEPHLARVEIIDGIRTQNLTEREVEAYYQRTLKAFEEAEWACCSTEELATALRVRGTTTFCLCNGFTEAAYRRARFAVRRRRTKATDELVRIGYAAGTRTHQRDFAQVAEALASVLRERPNCRLVLYRHKGAAQPLVDPSEFDAFHDLQDRIEWRDFVPQEILMDELAQFDINLAPLETGNPFCESKSELKIVQAALVDVCTVASPTGPFRRAIRPGQSGFLAEDFEQWKSTLLRLVDDPALRRAAGRAAFRDVLWTYGPHRRAELAAAILDQTLGDARTAARAGVVQTQCLPGSEPEGLILPPGRIVFESDRLGEAEVTVVVPLHNYQQYVVEALDSVAAQTLKDIDIVVVDDASADSSLAVAEHWMRGNAERFNRAVLLQNAANAGLGPTRNAAIDAAETVFILPLDADNRLLPNACEALLSAIRDDQAAFVYPLIRKFGGADAIIGKEPYSAQLLVGGNTIDAMAIIRKDCWAAVNGYARLEPQGWEDYDFWCCIAEKGMWGRQLPEILAEYRVHGASMQTICTDAVDNKKELLALMKKRHPWVSLVQSFTKPERQGSK
jgi:glycosyltransferase involved in cell wall biosynthesis